MPRPPRPADGVRPLYVLERTARYGNRGYLCVRPVTRQMFREGG